MEQSDTILKIVNTITFVLLIMFIVITLLKLTNHNHTFEQAIIVIGSIIIGHQFYLSKKISKLDGKFGMFENEFREYKQETKQEFKDLKRDFFDFRSEVIEFKHEIKHELKLLNKSLA